MSSLFISSYQIEKNKWRRKVSVLAKKNKKSEILAKRLDSHQHILDVIGSYLFVDEPFVGEGHLHITFACT